MMFDKWISTYCESSKSDGDAVSFLPTEIFFSRTDRRGRILAGNAIFQRISQYGWQELLDKPHNIIRHSDMPRGVFWLLWDRIRRGELTGAYVKNRTKDGRHYWVFAIVGPADDGFLSVRIKPCGPSFELVREEYSNLLKLEMEQRLPPSASASHLALRLRELGFDDYDAFMAHALTSEVAARNSLIGRRADSLVASFQALMDGAQAITAATTKITEAYATHQFVPLNLLVQAGRLGHAGSAIGAISGNYSLLAEEIKAELVSFGEASKRVAASICKGAFMMSTAKIQQEAIRIFADEAPVIEVDRLSEMAHLNAQEQAYMRSAQETLLGIREEVERFHCNTLDLRRLVSGLSAIRVMGKVESGRLAASVLSDLIADLEAFQALIAAGLGEISFVNQKLRQNIAVLVGAEHNLGIRITPSV